MLVASDKGHGLIVDIDSALAQTRSGKQVLNLPSGARRWPVVPRKEPCCSSWPKQAAIDFPLNEIPEMTEAKASFCNAIKMEPLLMLKHLALPKACHGRWAKEPALKQICLLGKGVAVLPGGCRQSAFHALPGSPELRWQKKIIDPPSVTEYLIRFELAL